MDLASLTLDDFSSRLGDVFRISSTGAADVELELVSAEKLKSSAEAGSGETAFSILFRGPLDRVLEQSICELEHAELGTLGIFIVPVKQDAAGIYYEAVFTRVSQ